MRLQSRSPSMVIHIKVGQDPSQPVYCHSLIFARTLSTSNSRNDHTKIQLFLILLPESCQEDTLQMSHNLKFDFELQHMEKSNPRAH